MSEPLTKQCQWSQNSHNDQHYSNAIRWRGKLKGSVGAPMEQTSHIDQQPSEDQLLKYNGVADQTGGPANAHLHRLHPMGTTNQ
jgi:hypothetical protein